MSKKVISFRLSEQDLTILDSACKATGMNRSQAISSAIELLRYHFSKEGKLQDRVPFSLQKLKVGRE